METFTGLRAADANTYTAILLPHTTIEAVGNAIAPHGLAMENMGHIDKQTLAGAISTGTHGAGNRFPNLHSYVVSGSGEIYTFDEDHRPVYAALIWQAASRDSCARFRLLPVGQPGLVPSRHRSDRGWPAIQHFTRQGIQHRHLRGQQRDAKDDAAV